MPSPRRGRRSPMPDEKSSLDERVILDIAFDAFVEVDSLGLITGWNSKAEHTFGWSRPEAIGQPANFVVPERHRGAFESGLRTLLESEHHRQTDRPIVTTCLRRDGREFPAELAVARVRHG